jgi:hypothetical protein
VGTDKRARQKANRAQRQAEEQRAAKTNAVKRNVIRWVIVIVAAIVAVVLIAWVGGAFDGDDDSPDATVPLTFPEISVATTVPDSIKPDTSVTAGDSLPATDVTTAAP